MVGCVKPRSFKNNILSDNARPFDLVKLTNPEPFALPWIFRHIDLVKLTGFVTRLEESRDFANPYLADLRLDVKPHPYVSIGLSRVAIFGGAGRHVDSGVIWDVITAGNENVVGDPGNQLGSFDAKIVLPFSFQEVVLYGELGGEDEAGSLPSRNAHLAGVYLPGAFGLDKLDLRVEYGETYISKYPRAAGYPRVRWHAKRLIFRAMPPPEKAVTIELHMSSST